MADQLIRIKVPDAFVESTIAGILREKPNIEADIDGVSLWTTKQWITELARRYLKLLRKNGLDKLATDNILDDDAAIIIDK